MLASLFSVLAVLGAASVSASPVERWTQSVANCRDFYADITAMSNNSDYTGIVMMPSSQQVLVQAEVDQYTTGSTISQQIASAPSVNVSGTYSMWFEYCEPMTGTPKGVFQTHHGLVGNAGYWNVMIGGRTDNSFAQSAAAAGWATLSYDRLGVGRSAHPDGISVVQISYEAAQSVAIAGMLRAGSFPGIAAFNTVVGVGHSYGSNLLIGVASSAPNTFDQSILTGFTANVTQGPLGLAGFASTIAGVAYPDRFSSLSNDYVSTPSVSADQMEFFHYPNYTQEALDKFTTTKGEYTLGQLNSIGGTFALARPDYNKPTFVITGDRDAPYCTSDCMVTSLGANMTQLDTARPLFPAVADSDFATYVVPDTAHGINFHTTAYDAYQQIINFVTSHM